MNPTQKTLIFVFVVAFFPLAMFFLLPNPAQISISDVNAQPVAGNPASASIFLKLANEGAADRLLGVEVDPPAKATLMNPEPDREIVIPAQSKPQLASDGAHIMVTGLTGELQPGALIPLRLAFAQAGRLTTKAKVAEPSADPHAMHKMAAMGGQQAPADTALSMMVEQSGDNSWRVQLALSNFNLVKVDDGAAHVPGEGHGHLYVNGLKMGRLYDPVARIGALPPGRHLVRVTLNTHTHQAYLQGDQILTVTQEIIVE